MVADLRLLLRLGQGRQLQPSAAIFDAQALQSTPESGTRAGYDGHKRVNRSKVHTAVDIPGHLLALLVTPANSQDRTQVATFAEAVRNATGEQVELAFVDQGDTGEPAEEATQTQGIQLHVVKLEEAKHGFVPCPGAGWLSARLPGRPASGVWSATRMPRTLTGLHLVAFAYLMLQQAATFLIRASP